MQTVASSLFLLVTVAMTVHAKDDISDNPSLTPTQDHMYLFDIATDASVSAVKEALKDFTIDQSFKIIGEDRMIFALRSNSTAQLRKLTFPSGSKVTQYPVEAMKEYLDMYGAGTGWEEDYTQAAKMNTIYAFLDWEMLLPKTLSTTSFATTLRAWTKAYRKTHGILKPLCYPLLATYPPRFLVLIKWEENAMQHCMKEGFDVIGGPGTGTVDVRRAVRV